MSRISRALSSLAVASTKRVTSAAWRRVGQDGGLVVEQAGDPVLGQRQQLVQLATA